MFGVMFNNLNFGSFFHVDVFVDVLFDEILLFFLLSLCDLLMEDIFVAEHVLFIADIVLF